MDTPDRDLIVLDILNITFRVSYLFVTTWSDTEAFLFLLVCTLEV
jgi:hypothetical protein